MAELVPEDEVAFTLDDLGWGHLTVTEGGLRMSAAISPDHAMVVARAVVLANRLGYKEANRG